MTSSHQSPFGRSRQQPRISSPLFSTSDDNTASSSVLSSKSSTISGGAEGSSSCIVGGTNITSKNTTTTAAAAAANHSSIEDKLQKDINNRALSKKAQMENDAMVYLDGPQIYTCGQCRTHLTSHDDIISKSFHGRHGMYSSLVYNLVMFCLWASFANTMCWVVMFLIGPMPTEMLSRDCT